MQFSRRMERFPDEIFAALNHRKIEMEKKGKTIYNLSVGTPDFITPEHIRKALSESAMDPESWKYTLRDTEELIDAVIFYYRDRYGVTLRPEQVTSCAGSQEGMGHLGLVLCDEGDTVLLPGPCYPAFIACANIAMAEPYFYPMKEETGFLPDLSSIPDEVADRAKFMIVSLPSNPLGSVGNDAFYHDLIAFARHHDLLIVHDNAYSDIIFDGNIGKSFLSYEDADKVGVEFFSLSKSYDVTGARLSFLVGREDIVKAFYKLRSQYDFGMFLPMQKAAIAALRGPRDSVTSQNETYQKRRDALCGGFRSIGWNVPDSHGSMFVWAKIPSRYHSSMDFCMDLMEKSGVICTPGSSFGPMGEGYVRFALVLPEDKIREVIQAVDACGILREE